MVTAAFGFLGFTDDYAKVTKQNTKGVSSRIRLIAGFVIAALAGYAAARLHPADMSNQLALPVFKDTLVIISGEFGRTPVAQGDDGRDHNPYGFTMWFAGGGVPGGEGAADGGSHGGPDLARHGEPGAARAARLSRHLAGAGVQQGRTADGRGAGIEQGDREGLVDRMHRIQGRHPGQPPLERRPQHRFVELHQHGRGQPPRQFGAMHRDALGQERDDQRIPEVVASPRPSPGGEALLRPIARRPLRQTLGEQAALQCFSLIGGQRVDVGLEFFVDDDVHDGAGMRCSHLAAVTGSGDWQR